MSLKRNVVWNLAGMGLPLLLGVVAIPYLYRHLGTEKIGILTLIWALIGYFSLFDFGLGRALTQQVSISRAAGQEERLPGLIKSGLLFTAGTGLLGGILLAALAYPLGFEWLKVSKELQEITALSLLVAAIGIPMTTVTTGLRGVLEAYEDFPHVNLLRLVLGVSNFGLPMLCVLWLGPSLTLVVGSLVAARFVLLMAHLWLVERKLLANWRKATFDRKQLRLLFSFGAWMTVSNVIGPLMVTADRFIISAILGTSVVAYYTIPSEMLARVLILPSALTAVLFPRLTAVMITDPFTARNLYNKSLKLVTLALAPVCLSIAIGSYWGLSVWLGRDFARHSWMLVVLMSAGVFLNSIAFVSFAAVQAAGHVHVTAKIHIVEFIIYVPLLVYSLHQFGLLGAAIVGVIRVAGDLVALAIVAHQYGFDSTRTRAVHF